MLFGNTVALGPIFPVDLERLFRWMDNADRLTGSIRKHSG
jgi:hypothetical protein|tara:strand:+ start:1224 stop:1343 length:120 start_codon:yes stop_codon:yes gene_type:complete